MPPHTIDDVILRIDTTIVPLAPEEVDVADALNRVLAADAVAYREFPPFDRAEIAGVALRASETVGASAYNPLSFRLCNQPDVLPAGAAMKVGVGTPLIGGADSVMPSDFIQEGATGTVEIIETIVPDHGIERRASHFAQGTALLQKGRRIRVPDLATLMIGGVRRVPVVRRPRISVVSAVDDIGAIDDEIAAAVAILRGRVERDGGFVAGTHRIQRSVAALRQLISSRESDVTLILGGPKNGLDQQISDALEHAEAPKFFDVALNPGGSIVIGRGGHDAWIFSLPGSPASCFWAYEVVIGRAIRRLAGHDSALPFRCQPMTLSRKIVSAIGMAEVYPVRYREDTAEPIFGHHRSSLLAVSQADGFVIVSEKSEGIPAGATVRVYLFDDSARSFANDFCKDMTS